MVIASLFNHNFLEKPEDCDILCDFNSASRKTIAIEVEQNLSYRFMSTITENMDELTKKGPLNLPMLAEPIVSAIDWKLPSWKHVKWTLHSLAPVFSLSLEALPSISNAVKIYCLWLKSPESRPACITLELEEEFVTTILLDFTELFVARKLLDSKSANVASTKRHSELCNMVIKTIINELIPSSNLLRQPASATWNTLTRLVLGVTDDLLWRDGQNYLADDLAEPLLMASFYCLLKSSIYDESLWKKVSECFRLWCHRVKSVLIWGSLTVSLTEAVARILHSSNKEATQEISIGIHTQLKLSVDNEFIVFSWSRITKLLPKATSLSPDIYLRSTQVLEKLIEIWLEVGSVADINTIFLLYGDYIFDACNADKQAYDSGRSIVLSCLCKILAFWQHRIAPDEKFLAASYATIQNALSADGTILNCVLGALEPALFSNQAGIRCLLLPIFTACRKLVKRYAGSKNSVSEELRMKCYRLLAVSSVHFSNDLTIMNSFGQVESMNGLYSSQILGTLTQSASSAEIVSIMALDTLIFALNVEESMPNVRFLLNMVTSDAFRVESPLVPVVVKILEESLYLERWNTETLLANVRCLEQLAKAGSSQQILGKRVCMSLITLAESLFNKEQLSSTYFLIISIYEASFAWLVNMDQFELDCAINTLNMLTKFMTSLGGTTEKTQSKAKKGQTLEAPTIYGVRNRKTLTSRVFSTEVGAQDVRENSLSPTLLKGIEEIVADYTDSAIQRVMNLLLQKLTSMGDLIRVSNFNEAELSQEMKYFAFSSSVIIGFSADFIVMRNSVCKYAWKMNFETIQGPHSPPASPFPCTSTHLDLDIPTTLNLFQRSSVIIADNADDQESLLNNDVWMQSLQNDTTHCEQILTCLEDAQKHLNCLLEEIPKKSLLIPVENVKKSPSKKSAFSLFSQLGLTLPSTRALLIPFGSSEDLYNDLRKLDDMVAREIMSLPIYYHANDRQLPVVSQGFGDFFNGLGKFNSSNPACPRFWNHSVQVDFSLVTEMAESSAPIMIVWSECVESLETLPNNIPFNSSTLVYLIVSPMALCSSLAKGHFYRVRILLSKSAPAEAESFKKYSNIFGPVFDGMIVEKQSLGHLVREAAISAHMFVLRFIQNAPNPIMRRQALIRSLVFKNYQSLGLVDFYSTILGQ